MISLRKLQIPFDGRAEAEYVVSSQNGNMSLEADIKVITQTNTTGAAVRATVDFGECTAPTPEEAFDKLAQWMEQTAKELRARKPAPIGLPVY